MPPASGTPPTAFTRPSSTKRCGTSWASDCVVRRPTLRNWLRDGDIFFLYLIWYPVGRFWVEMFRPDAWRMGTFATAQWVAIGGIILGGVGLLVNHLRHRSATSGGDRDTEQPSRCGPSTRYADLSIVA